MNRSFRLTKIIIIHYTQKPNHKILSVNVYITYPSRKRYQTNHNNNYNAWLLIYFYCDLESLIAIGKKLIIVVNIPSQSLWDWLEHIIKVLHCDWIRLFGFSMLSL